ncbi:hypothetical protein FGG78_21985 [Thioclava sp. BHET1]|nr:hypothetical protein FGG78_21985 [Thioclava sp. BHET1]
MPYLTGDYGMTAQRTADTMRARRRKLIRLDDLRNRVIDRLEKGWRPEQIAGRLGYDGQPVRVTHETITDGYCRELSTFGARMIFLRCQGVGERWLA